MSRPTENVDILVSGCDVVTMDDAGTVLRDGAVAVDGEQDRLDRPGRSRCRDDEARRRCIDGADRIAMPGMIDGHVHTAQQLLRGKLSEIEPQGAAAQSAVEELLHPVRGHAGAGGRLSQRPRRLRQHDDVGTTCFAEAGGPHPDEMARAAVDTGIRGFVALSTVDHNTAFAGRTVPGSMMMTTTEAFDRNVALVKRWKDHPRVQAWMSMRQIIVCTPELIGRCRDAAQEHGVKIHTHLAEGTYEVDYALENYGKRPTEYLGDLGVLGRHLHCAHSVMLSADEMDLYVEHKLSACHCAMGNYGIGIPRLQEMWRRGRRYRPRHGRRRVRGHDGHLPGGACRADRAGGDDRASVSSAHTDERGGDAQNRHAGRRALARPGSTRSAASRSASAPI